MSESSDMSKAASEELKSKLKLELLT